MLEKKKAAATIEVVDCGLRFSLITLN